MHKRNFLWFILLPLLILISSCTAAGPTQSVTQPAFSDDTPVPTATQTLPPPIAAHTATVTLLPPPSEPAPQIEPTSPAPTLASGSNLDIASIHMVDRQTGWAVGGVNRGRNHILYTKDGASTFQDVTPPIGPSPGSGFERWAVGEFSDVNVARVLFFPAILEHSPPGGANVVVWRTQDAGLTWEQSEVISSSVLGTQDFPPRLEFIDRDLGWFMARNGGAGMHRYPISLYRTLDGGASWDVLIEALGGGELQSCRKTAFVFGDTDNGLATIDNCPVDGPAVELTRDGGITWNRIILPPPDEDPDTVANAYCETTSPQFIGPNTLVLSASCTAYQDVEIKRALLYRSSDNGQTWDAWEYPGGELIYLDETRGFALSRKVFWTADGGVTWEEQKTVNWDGQFSFVDPDYGWAVARAEDELALVTTADRGQKWLIIEPVLTP